MLMGLDIETGSLSDSPDGLMPLNASGLPGVAPGTYVQPGQLAGPTVQARDTVGEYAAPLAALEADIRGAQSAGMDARHAMLAHYAADVLPVGTSYGDDLALPVVPEDASAPSSDFLFAEGDQPGKGT